VHDVVVNRIPLFPLRSVLCPGVALPLHIFEARYRLMVDRCLERDEPFGVVLLREGREVGPLRGEFAAVGTTAAIRRAGRYPDGRFDILTVGQRRFHLESVDSVSEPYLVGRVSFLDEPVGPEQEVQQQAERVGQRFLDYLRLLQPAAQDDGPEIEIEFEIEVDEPETAAPEENAQAPRRPEDIDTEARADGARAAEGADALLPSDGAAELSPEQRRELLMAAAQRLLGTEDPTALSYVLTALVQVDLASRQALLEARTTLDRLRELDHLLVREGWLLREGLRPIIFDAASLGRRAN
jgi:Lon protease-like protein